MVTRNGTEPPATKKHFLLLDGLRGIAALAVVVFHFMEWVYSDYSKNFVGHGFLAVDFFFCLSGFVIAYAYDNRIESMGKKSFFVSRLIRLHPMVIFGSVIGLLAFLLDPFAAEPSAYSFGKIALIFLASILLIPYPAMPERFFNLFSFNAPSWSLFWEYVANIFYALFLHKLNRKFLLVLAAIAAVILGLVSHKARNLLGGWAGENFWDGGARVAYSFLAGMIIYRYQWIISNRLGFVGLTIMLCLAFTMPLLRWNWLMEWMVVVFYFPLIVSLGAGSTMRENMKAACRFSGNISYPLYMSHYWAIWIFGHYLTTKKPGLPGLAYIIPFGTLFLVLFAWLVMVVYDTPVRKWLTEKRINKQ